MVVNRIYPYLQEFALNVKCNVRVRMNYFTAWQLAFAELVLKKYIYKLIDKFMISATYYIND